MGLKRAQARTWLIREPDHVRVFISSSRRRDALGMISQPTGAHLGHDSPTSSRTGGGMGGRDGGYCECSLVVRGREGPEWVECGLSPGGQGSKDWTGRWINKEEQSAVWF